MKKQTHFKTLIGFFLLILTFLGWGLYFKQLNINRAENHNSWLINEAIRQIVNAKNTGAEFDNLIGEHFLEGDPLTPVGRKAFKLSLQSTFKKIPDIHADIASVISSNDSAAAVINWSGTYDNKTKLSGRTSELYKIEKGKIVSRQVLIDEFLPIKK